MGVNGQKYRLLSVFQEWIRQKGDKSWYLFA